MIIYYLFIIIKVLRLINKDCLFSYLFNDWGLLILFAVPFNNFLSLALICKHFG